MKKIERIDRLRRYAAVITLIFASTATAVFADPDTGTPENLTPTDVVKTAISDVLNDMRNHESLYEQEPARLDELVRQKVVPYFDFSRMTRLAMARYWNSASASQRLDASDAFQNLFIVTYGKQLFDYRNTTAKVEALPGATEQKANLKLKANSQRGEYVTLFLRLEKQAEKWHIIDVNADGVSYIVTMRGQFSETLSQQGVDGLIKFLNDSAQKKAS